MSKYVISCCTPVDITKEQLEERDIFYCPFHYYLDNVHYYDDLWESMTPDKFYQAMVDGADTRTSQINPEEFIKLFTPLLEDGKDILHVTLSSGISGVLNSALIAQEELREKYPERKIYVVDSLTASAGYGLFVDTLADKRDEGMDIDALYAWAVEHAKNLNGWFFTTDLTFFIKGGRVSKAAGFVGGVLNICPLLNVNLEGKLIPREKIRTKRKVMKALVDKMEELCDDGKAYSKKVFLSQSACMDDAKEVAQMIENRFPKMNGKVRITSIGTTIGSHTGPGTVALFWWGKDKEV